ncbi:MAG TPA: glucose-1-phosphate thymidylyltransferase, partial [Saprospiraceae bacterium]|nr:glucose-1-phosphate thymidylyltransferase [Saprospiraceae bacterium]
IPPVRLGRNCRIQNSILGPHVSIGDDTEINNSLIREAIIGNYTILNNIVIEKSIIGNDVVIRGKSQSFNIGDNTEMDVL